MNLLLFRVFLVENLSNLTKKKRCLSLMLNFLSPILSKLLSKGGKKIINRSGNKTDILCLVA